MTGAYSKGPWFAELGSDGTFGLYQPMTIAQMLIIVAAIMFLGWVLLILCPNVGGN